MTARPVFSIVIPTYNEGEDIEACLKSAIAQNHRSKEIIVIDGASTDGTQEILKKYEKKGAVRAIYQKERKGVAHARNLGIQEARGEIVVLLNADNLPQPDFLTSIQRHYEEGADFVVVWPEAVNTERVIADFLNSQAHHWYDNRDDLVWSEGFSVRKEAILLVGGLQAFPKASAGEDVALGIELDRRFRRVLDKNIVIPHIATYKLGEFMRLRYERGRGTPFFFWIYKGFSLGALGRLLLRNLAATLARTVLIYPFLRQGYYIAKNSTMRGMRGFPVFVALEFFDQWCERAGEVEGFWEILRGKIPR